MAMQIEHPRYAHSGAQPTEPDSYSRKKEIDAPDTFLTRPLRASLRVSRVAYARRCSKNGRHMHEQHGQHMHEQNGLRQDLRLMTPLSFQHANLHNPAHELKESQSQFRNLSRMRLASVGFG